MLSGTRKNCLHYLLFVSPERKRCVVAIWGVIIVLGSLGSEVEYKGRCTFKHGGRCLVLVLL